MKIFSLFSILALTSPAFSFVIAPHPSAQRYWSPLFAEAIKDTTDDAEERMSKSVDSARLNLASIRTGRASSNMLDRVRVDYYGAPTPLNQLAAVSVPSAQQLSVDPYDKSIINDIANAICDANLGLTPNSDGSIIRINIPALTEERRKEMLKQCKAIGEEGKVAVRNVRRDAVDSVKKMEKNSDIGKDEMLDGLDALQKMTDEKVKEIDTVVAKKEKDVMTV
jgi:ribosome recycling factor